MNFWLYLGGLTLLFVSNDIRDEYGRDRRWWLRHLDTVLFAVGAVILWNGIGGS